MISGEFFKATGWEGYKRLKIWMISFMDDPSFKQVRISLDKPRLKKALQFDEPIFTFFLHNISTPNPKLLK